MISLMDLDHIQASSCNVLFSPTSEGLLSNTISCFNIRHLLRKGHPSNNGTRALFSVRKRDHTSENSLEALSLGWAKMFSSWVRCVFWHRIDYLGIDNRVERTRYRVNYEATYTKLFNRVNQEIVKGQTKHLIIMLGRSPLVVTKYNRYSYRISATRLAWNNSDKSNNGTDQASCKNGNVRGTCKQIRWRYWNSWWPRRPLVANCSTSQANLCRTAKHHKKVKAQYGRTNVQERNVLIQSLQQISQQNSVRITILGGDVHLGAVGQFYSNKKLNIPLAQDHRYMANIISSAIVNTPPSETVGDLLYFLRNEMTDDQGIDAIKFTTWMQTRTRIWLPFSWKMSMERH